MEKPILSIIVPVYNLEKYVYEAFDSIYNQVFTPELIEVVVVNDGSTDHSGEILANYKHTYSNFRVFTNSNHGVSYSRNYALDNLKGEYVLFLDGDDLLLPYSINRIIDYIKKHTFDVLYTLTYIGLSKKFPSHVTPKNVNLNETYKISQLGDFCNGAGSVCGGVYNMSFLRKNNLRFPVGIANGEDTIFNYILYTKNPLIMFSDIDLYLVRERVGSASRNVTVDRACRCVLNIQFLVKLLKEEQFTEEQLEYIYKAFWNSVGNGVGMFIESGIRDSKFVQDKLEIRTIPYLKIKSTTILQKIKVFIFNHSFSLYFSLFKFREI